MNAKNPPNTIERIATGVRNLDDILGGGLPARSITVLGGTPGSGKTTLTQQICFNNASPARKCLFFQTLSEPTAKILRYLQQLSFCDRKKLTDGSVEFVDLGSIMRSKGLEQASQKMIEHLKRVRPSFVVVDSFKVFSDLAGNREDLRKFAYEVAVTLMAWECTGFLLGEFSDKELHESPLSSILDGIILMTVQESSGEQQRFIQITKMRGTDHSREEFPFALSSDGVEIYASKGSLPVPNLEKKQGVSVKSIIRRKIGIKDLDRMIGLGVPAGSSLLVSGVTGTGKTRFAIEAIYRGASEFNEKGIYFSFEETTDTLLSIQQDYGWDLNREIKRGMIEIVHLPQPQILVERDFLLMQEQVKKFKAQRIAVDSLSGFLHKVTDPLVVQEKVTQLVSLVRDQNALGFFVTSIPYGQNQISMFGVEETIVDGIIIITCMETNLERKRYLEIYKLRNNHHALGKAQMHIKGQGMTLSMSKKTGVKNTKSK